MSVIKDLKKNKFLFFLFSKTMRIERRRRKALKNEGVEMIKAVENALSDSDCLYFATCGTLLGIVRNHNFLENDNDVDYGLFTPEDFDWSKFEAILKSNGFKKIRQFEVQGIIREQTYSRNKLTVDFFTIFKKEGKYYSYGFFKQDNFLYPSDSLYSIRETSFVPVVNTKRVDFLNTKVTVPYNEIEVLVCIYGKSWNIPNPNWDDNSKERSNTKILDILANAFFWE